MNSEADTCRKYVVPRFLTLGWDTEPHSIAEQRTITDGRVIPVGKEGFVRKPPKRVDYLLRYPKLTRLRAGNFVYPKLMAWEGALGIVPVECDGLVVSTEFPVFEIDEKVMLPEVIDTYFKSPEVWPGLSGRSGGTNVRRRRLNPNDFLRLQIPWPDQETQSAIKECVSRVSAIRPIQAETATGLDAMPAAILAKAFKGEL